MFSKGMYSASKLNANSSIPKTLYSLSGLHSMTITIAGNTLTAKDTMRREKEMG